MYNGYLHSEPKESLPVSLPQTYLPYDSSLPIMTVNLLLGQRLRLRYVSLYVPSFKGAQLPVSIASTTDNTGPVPVFYPPDSTPNLESNLQVGAKVSSEYENIFLGLYSGQFEKADQVTGAPIFLLESPGSGVVSTDPRYKIDIDSPGQYTLMLVNNTTGFDFEVVVNGAFKLY